MIFAAAPSLPFLLHWHTEPFLIGGLLGFAWLYSLAIGPLQSRFGSKLHSIDLKSGLLFFSAIVISYLAVASPLDQLAEGFLMSAHMFQHMVLILVVPPLLICGVPVWLWNSIFCNKLGELNVFGKCMRILLNPVVAWTSFTFMMNFWHWPLFYEAALQNKPIHIFEHLTMVISAFQMWWPLIGRGNRLYAMPYGPRMIYIVLLMIGQFPVFGSLTLSEDVLYPTYLYAPRIVNLTALQDQVLGGLMMNVLGMFVYLFMFARAFYEWYAEEN
jgi:putative membrane protein